MNRTGGRMGLSRIVLGLTASLLLLGVIVLKYGLMSGEQTHRRTESNSAAVVSQVEVPHNSIRSDLLPDLEHIPIFDNPTVVEALEKDRFFRNLAYEAPADQTTVAQFYRDTLPKYGWELIDETNRSYISAIYDWTDPAGNAAWHMELQLGLKDLGKTDARPGVTEVNIEYHRYPDTDKNLPVYPGSVSVGITSTMELDPDHPQRRVRRTRMRTYLAEAKPEQIASYYNSSMEQYGWEFIKWKGWNGFAEPRNEQAGDINSDEGIYFTAQGPIFQGNPYLFITARPAGGGQTEFQLRLIDSVDQPPTPRTRTPGTEEPNK